MYYLSLTLWRSLGMWTSERDQSTKRGGKLSLCKQVMVGTGIEHCHNGVKNVLKLYLQQFFQHTHIIVEIILKEREVVFEFFYSAHEKFKC